MSARQQKRSDTMELGVSLGVVVPLGFWLARRLRGGWIDRLVHMTPRWLQRISMSSDLFAGLALLIPGLLAGPWRPGDNDGTPAACVHRYVRHPVYAGIPMVLSALGWLTGRLGLFVAGLLWLPVGFLLGWGEDKRLQGRYHGTYRRYLETTPAIFPDMGRLGEDMRRCTFGDTGEDEDDQDFPAS